MLNIICNYTIKNWGLTMLLIKRIEYTIGAVLLSATLAGCAIRPIPTDFGKSIKPEGHGEITTTTAIVQRIRCEARQAIAKVTMGYIRDDLMRLRNNANRTPQQQRVYHNIVDERGRFSFDRIVSHYYRNGKFKPELGRSVQKAPNERFSLAQELGVVQKFAGSGVGYLFTFETSLDNDVSGGLLNFNLPIGSGKLAFGLGGEYKRQRKNTREFKVVETIESIVLDPDLVPDNYVEEFACNEFDIKYKSNYHFPIYGKINLLDTFSTFAGVIVSSKTSGVVKDSKEKSFPNFDTTFKKFASQDLKDEIKFTTTVSGSAKPALTLTPLSSGLSLTSGTLGVSGNRKDIHTLVLILKENGVGEVLDKLELERLDRNGNSIIAVAVP